jgi:hypothetical protein
MNVHLFLPSRRLSKCFFTKVGPLSLCAFFSSPIGDPSVSLS